MNTVYSFRIQGTMINLNFQNKFDKKNVAAVNSLDKKQRLTEEILEK